MHQMDGMVTYRGDGDANGDEDKDGEEFHFLAAVGEEPVETVDRQLQTGCHLYSLRKFDLSIWSTQLGR